MRIFIRLAITAAIIIALVIGCSKKRSNPVMGNLDAGLNPPVGETGLGNADAGFNQKPLWVLHGEVDTLKPTANIDLLRSVNVIGDMFDADITQFLLTNPCSDCVKLSGVGLDATGSNLIINFMIKHPFADITKRPDLHAFDIRAIFQTSATQSAMRITSDLNGDSAIDPTETVYPGGGFITNADGYTTHFSTGRFSSNCHPFKRYFVNPNSGTFDPHNPTGYNVMKTGAGWETQSFMLDTTLTPATFEFDLVIDGSYGQSAVFATRSDPQYYLPAFNRKEAWSVEIVTVNNTLQGGNSSSFADLQIKVKDWQAGATVSPTYPDCPLDNILVQSGVKEIIVDIPNVNSSIFDSATTPSSGTGTNADPFIFDIRVNNDLSASDGAYYGLVAVRDDIDTQQGPYGIPEGPSGFPKASADIRDYTAYAFFTLNVGGGGQPTGGVDITGLNSVFGGDSVTLTATPDDPGGTYLWSTTSSEIEFVGSITAQTITVKALSPSSLINGAQVNVEYKAATTELDTFDMTCWSLQYIVPGVNYKQFINLSGSGQNGRTTNLQVQVVPPGIGEKQIEWSFIDPDEPSQSQAADESGTYESDLIGNDNRGAEDSGFGSSLAGINPNVISSGTTSQIAQAPFTVSSYGGDNYIIKAYPNDVSASFAVESPVITVWRWMDVPVYSMQSSSGTSFFYEPDYANINNIYSGGYIYINATRSQGGLPYNSVEATDGVIALEGAGFWPVTQVPAINYLLSNSGATEGWHKINMCGIRQFGDPSPPLVDPLNVLGIAYSYWEVPEPDPFHYMYYNYFFVCTGRIDDLFSPASDAELHVFAHELGHSLGLPHNNVEAGEGQFDPFWPANKYSGGLGLMDALVSTPVTFDFTRAELDFLRGDYDGPYFY